MTEIKRLIEEGFKRKRRGRPRESRRTAKKRLRNQLKEIFAYQFFAAAVMLFAGGCARQNLNTLSANGLIRNHTDSWISPGYSEVNTSATLVDQHTMMTYQQAIAFCTLSEYYLFLYEPDGSYHLLPIPGRTMTASGWTDTNARCRNNVLSGIPMTDMTGRMFFYGGTGGFMSPYTGMMQPGMMMPGMSPYAGSNPYVRKPEGMLVDIANSDEAVQILNGYQSLTFIIKK